jgi:photosystem II stability/assembly factor-like uncharacterized protein
MSKFSYRIYNRDYIIVKVVLKYIFIAACLTFSGVSHIFSQDVWIEQQTPTTKWLYRCSFSDSLNGWAAGEDGVIIRTTNGGNNWNMLNSSVNFFIYDIFFLNNRLGWALANDNFDNGTAVLTTTNGGDTWSNYRYPDSTTLLYGINFKDSLTGYMVGYSGVIVRTTNGGTNWNAVNVDSSSSTYFPIYRVDTRGDICVASGGAYDILGAVWVSSNSGLNWKSYAVTAEPLFSIAILSSEKIITLGGDFEFGAIQSRTYNTGNNWTYDYLNTFGITRGVSFRTESEGWAVLSISPRFFFTLDTGNTWDVMDVPDTNGLYDIKFTDERHGYAVGINGTVYKYNPNVIGLSNNQTQIPVTNTLFQNYPNPFNPTTTIEYHLIAPSVVKIFIYDVTGKLVKQLYDGLKPVGDHSLMFDAAGLSSGLYLYKLEAGNYSETKKMVIIK